MEGELNDLHWFKSSASASGACVEVAHLPGGGVAVRDSKDRAKAPHVYTRREWQAFLTGAKNGEFDLPVALAGGASPESPGSLGSPGETTTGSRPQRESVARRWPRRTRPTALARTAARGPPDAASS
jgi:hypothetical protein